MRVNFLITRSNQGVYYNQYNNYSTNNTNNNYNNVSFGYSHELKTLYKKGKLPIEFDFYGSKLTKKNVTLEHLLPHSYGGRTTLDNLVLATRENNQARSNKPLEEFMDWYNINRYLKQFEKLQIGNISGKDYIKMILNTISKIKSIGNIE